ncbi:PLP-dependent transferase [Armillaria gallica]|uniref:PLP-dependent transferase n=1 Tax=Armillaria gallica TaxID=47427 RepID=A0A2H3CLN4_ARMGA|nr:PLP-dependent transferase [Armillaria gallica]
MNTALEISLQKSLDKRAKIGMPVLDLLHPAVSTKVPDFFSNDYLSITTNPQLNSNVLDALIHRKTAWLYRPSHAETEKYLQSHFNASAALMFSSGYNANVVFFGCVPQAEDIIVFDELIHAPVRDGIAAARTRNAYPFSHNSAVSFESCIAGLLRKRPEFLAGNLYSMDGGFSPLPQIIESLHRHIPKAYCHMVVDKAHTTGLYGSMGRGYDKVDTVLHTFGKDRGLMGAVILTSPIVRKYLVNYARPLIYTTSMPHLHLIGHIEFCVCVCVRATFDFISGPEDDMQVYECSQYFATKLRLALKGIPESVLAMCAADRSKNLLVSPIFPLLTSQSLKLAEYLNSKGYVAQAIPFPIVPKGQERIRVVIHADNRFSDIDTSIAILLDWVMSHWYSKNTEVSAMPEHSPRAML